MRLARFVRSNVELRRSGPGTQRVALWGGQVSSRERDIFCVATVLQTTIIPAHARVFDAGTQAATEGSIGRQSPGGIIAALAISTNDEYA